MNNISVTITKYEVLDLLLRYCMDFEETRKYYDLFKGLYGREIMNPDSYIWKGLTEFADIRRIVLHDNDECYVLIREEVSKEDWNRLIDMYNDEEYDVSDIDDFDKIREGEFSEIVFVPESKYHTGYYDSNDFIIMRVQG